MLSFLPGYTATPIGQVLGTDINMGLLSDKLDKLPLEDLVTHLKKSGYRHIVTVIRADEATQQADLPPRDPAIKTTRLYSVEKDLHALLHGGQPTTIGNNYLLIGAGPLIPSSQLEDAVFQLQLKGYVPVLMQAERYEYLQDNYRNIKRLLDRGCLFQTDILSLTGAHGGAAKKLSEKLIHDGYVSFVGSGIATTDEHKKFSSLMRSRKLSKLLASENIKNKELI